MGVPRATVVTHENKEDLNRRRTPINADDVMIEQRSVMLNEAGPERSRRVNHPIAPSYAFDEIFAESVLSVKEINMAMC